MLCNMQCCANKMKSCHRRLLSPFDKKPSLTEPIINLYNRCMSIVSLFDRTTCKPLLTESLTYFWVKAEEGHVSVTSGVMTSSRGRDVTSSTFSSASGKALLRGVWRHEGQRCPRRVPHLQLLCFGVEINEGLMWTCSRRVNTASWRPPKPRELILPPRLINYSQVFPFIFFSVLEISCLSFVMSAVHEDSPTEWHAAIARHMARI